MDANLGQIAYEAFAARMGLHPKLDRRFAEWSDLSDDVQTQWILAANGECCRGDPRPVNNIPNEELAA
jgi:hypothetical protein